MRITLISGMTAVFLASSALAAPANTSSESAAPAASAPGAATLTDADVRARIAAQGFGSVSDLSRDDKGLWHARAIKNGRRLNLIIDSAGKVQIDAGRGG